MGARQHIVVMGVSGSGKTTVATRLAERLHRPFAEGDDLHPPANVEKMRAGTPLTDDDRWPWLGAIRDWLSGQAVQGRSTVVTCSALRRTYRDVLRTAEGGVVFVHLAVDPAVVGRRLDERAGHFMPPSLLDSQYDALEPLGEDEDGITVPANDSPDRIVDVIVERLRLSG